jgi:coniferyl-aldehyde dehydrogenase
MTCCGPCTRTAADARVLRSGPPRLPPDTLTDLHRLYDLQRRAAATQPPPELRARLRSLTRLSEAVSQHSPALAASISADFGHRSAHETFLLELVPLQNAIRHAKRHLHRWMRPERRRVNGICWPNAAWVRYQPLGVVGIMAAWNYPLALSLLPVVDALAAGNRVLLKPSEHTPGFSRRLRDVLAEAIPEQELGVVLGGADVAEHFSRLPLDHLLFTGSTVTGRKVAMAAAANLTPVTLELGGKSPVFVCPDYGIEAAARDITFPKMATAGQTCIAPDYVLAPAASARALADALLAESRELYPSIDDNPDYTAIVNDRHYDRLHAAIDEARAGGAEVLVQRGGTAANRRMGLVVVLNAPLDCALMRDEIFGPVLPIVAYDTLDTAIAFVNERPKPLTLYCLTHDRSHREAGLFLHQGQDDLPFGGVGTSGIGAYHGHAGFRRFSHARSIHQVRLVNVLHFIAPPYGRLARLVIRFMGSRRAADACEGD